MNLILLVEDEYGIAEVLKLLFEADGYRVALASNGKAALELLAGEVPALILSDFMMPHMNGGELGIAVRNDPRLKDIPIVILSATSEVVVQRTFSDYDAFVVKPCELDALTLLVKRLVTAGRAGSQRSADVDESMRQLLKGIELPPTES